MSTTSTTAIATVTTKTKSNPIAIGISSTLTTAIATDTAATTTNPTMTLMNSYQLHMQNKYDNISWPSSIGVNNVQPHTAPAHVIGSQLLTDSQLSDYNMPLAAGCPDLSESHAKSCVEDEKVDTSVDFLLEDLPSSSVFSDDELRKRLRDLPASVGDQYSLVYRSSLSGKRALIHFGSSQRV